MTDHDRQGDEPTKDTPLARLVPLLRLLASGLITGALVALLSSSVLKLWHNVSPGHTEKVWQVQDNSYKRVLGSLDNANTYVVSLEKIAGSNPEAADLIAKLKGEIGSVSSTLQASPYVTITEDASLSFNLVSPANAEETKTPPDQGQDHTIVYSLLGLVAFVLVAFCLLYLFTQDKAKKVFAEKTITSVLGFVFGLLTGSMTGKIK
jgi:hypothetical protein